MLWKGMFWRGSYPFLRVFCRSFWGHMDPCCSLTLQYWHDAEHASVHVRMQVGKQALLAARARVTELQWRRKNTLKIRTQFLPTASGVWRTFQTQRQRMQWRVAGRVCQHHVEVVLYINDKHSFYKAVVPNTPGFILGACFFLRFLPMLQLFCGHPAAWPHCVKICESDTSPTHNC